MQLAYLASEYPAISHTFVLREIEALRRAGVTVHTLSIRKPGAAVDFPESERREIANTYYVQSGTRLAGAVRSLQHLFRRPISTFKMVRAAMGLFLQHPGMGAIRCAGYVAQAALLAAHVRQLSVRHVHVHFANPAATVAYIAACGEAIDFSLSVHGPDVFYDVTANFLREKFSKAVFIRCISHYCRSQVLRLLDRSAWSKVFVVRLGIDLAEYTPRKPPGHTTPSILCLGRLVPAKGQHMLLLACAELQRRGIAVNVTIVGDGPDRPSLERWAGTLGLKDRVTFAGLVNRDQVHAYYDEADLFVLPSFAEGLPVVLMEAMAKKIPCISTRIAGIPELIDSGQNGLLTAASSVEELADAMARTLSRPHEAARYADEGFETVRAQYELSANCESLAREIRQRLTPMVL